jgi:prepilin-type N-terminal cleavage/methylation domain-containing protein
MNKKGFTLIEMIVVMAIIATLATIGSFGIKNFSKAQGVSTAVPIAEGAMSLAKNAAMHRPSRARLLIHATNDPTVTLNRERYLRYMIIQTLNYGPDERRDTADDFWEFTSRGISLPDSAWFIQSLSNQVGHEIPVLENVILPGNNTARCYYYEFNSQGILTNPLVGVKAPRFIISGGSMPPGSVEPIRQDDDKNVGGFVIWKKGNTSTIKHPSQIGL